MPQHPPLPPLHSRHKTSTMSYYARIVENEVIKTSTVLVKEEELSGDTLTILFPLRNLTITAPLPLRPPSQLITSLHTDKSTLKTPL